VESLSAGADIFELGCARGEDTFSNPAPFRSASGIDISDVAVQQANTEAQRRGMSNVQFRAGDAESTGMPDASVDLVYGSGIVHHLDTERCAVEVARILRPGGTAVFWEPLGGNPLIGLYRALTPKVRTEDEHPLVQQDIKILSQSFDVDASYYGLTTLTVVPLRNTPLNRLRGVAEKLDELAFRIPSFNRMAWFAVIVLKRRT
jgi:SAM-dependent methyltransferase